MQLSLFARSDIKICLKNTARRIEPLKFGDTKATRTVTQLMILLGFANYYLEFKKGYTYNVYPMQKLMCNKRKKIV